MAPVEDPLLIRTREDALLGAALAIVDVMTADEVRDGMRNWVSPAGAYALYNLGKAIGRYDSSR